MLYPLLFKPIFQERIWGGRSLERLYGKPLPAGKTIGESWEICDRPEAQSEVANGPLAGKTLHWLLENHGPNLLGSAQASGGRFPLLVKILDAKDKLSLQVHPPASKAAQFNGEPKTEMWFIADAKPGAELYVGLRRGVTRADFESKIRSGSVAECFHRVPVRTGDTMFLPSGRVHAIGAGLVIFEIQQNSDTTFRVFDWNRVDAQGQPRQLHVSESLECIDFEDFEPGVVRGESLPSQNGAARQSLVRDPLFTAERIELSAGAALGLRLETCAVVAVAAGTVRIEGSPGATLQPGQFALLPAALRSARLEAASEARLLVSQPGRA
jgi:mannose-6-phosphate isomerase